MKRQEIINIIADILEADASDISDEAILDDFDTWDSIAILSVISVLGEKKGLYLSSEDIGRLATVGDLIGIFEN